MADLAEKETRSYMCMADRYIHMRKLAIRQTIKADYFDSFRIYNISNTDARINIDQSLIIKHPYNRISCAEMFSNW